VALPTIEQMFGHALLELDVARRGLANARDWLKSDWRTQPTAAQVQAKNEVLRLIGEAKALIDQAKSAIYESDGNR
jgi:hypothetical protein